jgi:hypothetical protein
MEWTMISRLDPEYAKKRGELSMNTVFDESAINFVEMRSWERISMMPLKTPGYLHRLSPGYDTEDWDLIIEDKQLAAVPSMVREAEEIERNLRSLKI